MSSFDPPEFKIAFWNPSGPHGGEAFGDIIERKREEIRSNGWTLWSFQYRPMLEDWHRELSQGEFGGVYAFCSRGEGKDPAEDGDAVTVDCARYKPVGETEWRDTPKTIRASHPFRQGQQRRRASAFIVRRIIHPVPPTISTRMESARVEWLKQKEGWWRLTEVPPRSISLVRSCPEGVPLRKIGAVLELKPPYLAYLEAPGP